MRMSRFVRLLETWGADPARWPRHAQASAAALLAASPEARARMREAEALDDALARTTPQPEAAALARMRASIAARIARTPLPTPAAEATGWLRPLFQIGCGALATLAVCLIWLSVAGIRSGDHTDLLIAPPSLMLAEARF